MSNVKKNFIYNTLYQILAIITPLITTPYISRTLGAENIGIYSYSYSIAYYFAMFIILGLNNYGNRTIAFARDDKEKLSSTFCEIYLMQLLCAIVVSAIYLAYLVMFANNLMSWILYIYIFSEAIDINWFFFGIERFKLTVIRNTIIKILSTISIFLFIKSENDIYIYALILTMTSLFSQLSVWPFLNKFICLRKVSIVSVKKHIKSNFVLFIPIIAISIYSMMDKIMLGNLTNMQQVGFYENSEKIMSLPTAIVNSLGTVMLPRMSNLAVKEKNSKNINLIIEKSIYVAMFFSTSLSFGIMGLANLFVPWFYGESFGECIYIFQFLFPSCIFLAFANVIRTQYLIPNKKDKIYIESVFAGAVINIIGNYFLIPKYNAIGAAVATLLAQITVCVWQTYSIRKEFNIKKLIRIAYPFICVGLMMYYTLLKLPTYFNSTICNIIFKVILGGIEYIVLYGIYYIFKVRGDISIST